MDNQGNHHTQGQNRSFYPKPPPPPQLPQPVNQSFHPLPHVPLNAPYRGPPQPFSAHPRAPQVHVSSQVSHSYPTSDRQTMPWSQNVHQSLPLAPIPASGAYPSQRHVTQSQPLQPSIRPPSSNSGALSSNTIGSFFPPMQQCPSMPPMVSLPPPPPRPPPPPPPSNSLLIDNSGNQGLRLDSSGAGVSVLEDVSSVKALGDRTVTQIDVLSQLAEKNGARDAENDFVSHSPADSDIDMEDDITHPDGENHNRMGTNVDATCASTCRDVAHSSEQVRDKLPGFTEDENPRFSETVPFEKPDRGFNMQSNSDVTAPQKVHLETDNSESLHFSDAVALQPKNTSTADSDALKTDEKNGSPKMKLDEFGRLVRDGDTHSDSSDSPRYNRRHSRRDNRKRSRSRSRSVSPYNRRSPRKRKERRGRSRSFSPKRRTSRSRSPLYRRGNDLAGEKLRHERNQLKQCFDFQRGKCYRGATCRYSHHEPDKSERSRYESYRQNYRDLSPTSRGKVVPEKEAKDRRERVPKEIKDPSVESTKRSPDKSSVVANKDSVYSDYSMPLEEIENSSVRGYPLQYTKLPQQVAESSSADHVSHFPSLFPTASQAVNTTPSVPPPKIEYDTMSPDMHFHGNPQNYSYQVPLSYHQSNYTGPSNTSSTSLLPPPPPPPAITQPPIPVKTTPSQGMQHSSLLWNGLPPTDLQYRSQTGQYPPYAAASERNQVPESKNTEVTIPRNMHMNDLSSQQSDPLATRDLLIGYARQSVVNPSTNPSYNGKLSSPLTVEETNQPTSYMPALDGSRTSTHFLYQPVSSNFISSSSIQENATQLTTKYGDACDVRSGGASENVILLTGSSAPADLPRAISDEYDPFFDSIEPASNSFIKANHDRYEATGDCESIQRFDGSREMLKMDSIEQERGIAPSVEDSLLKEEFGETADAELGAVVSESHSVPKDETDNNDREIEINQVKSKKGRDSKPTKLFKNSIAAFVKEILKPSWRQGNMSKEAFKTIVKKTVDKVSGAMKGRHVPKSQSNINRYIDSSRGKLTKLVMGYVDKYVNA